MRISRLRNHVSAGALALAAVSVPALAQQSLPTIEVGARTHGSGHSAGKPQGAGGRSTGPTQAASGGGSGDGSGSGSGSYWQQLDEKKKIPEGSYVAPYSSTGTKTDTPIMDTPLNVQVVTPQQLKDRQVTTLVEAVRNVSGVAIISSRGTSNYVPGGSIVLRGFETSNYFRNGFRNSPDGAGLGQQFANVESVEVLKGSSAILYGLIEPGGIVNIVTKQPKEKPSYSVQQQIGSFRNFRTVIDATGPITQDKSILYRVSASYANTHSYIEGVRDDDIFVSPAVRWNIGPRTQATVEFEYDKAAVGGAYDFALTYDGKNINLPRRGQNYGEPFRLNRERFLFGLNESHEFNDEWKVRHNTIFVTQSPNVIQKAPNSAFEVPGAGIFVDRILSENRDHSDSIFTNIDLTGRFQTGELVHTLLIGGDFYRTNEFGTIEVGTPSSPISAFIPIHPGLPLDPTPIFARRTVNVSYNTGAYVQDQIKLPFGLHLLGGVRYQNIVQTSKFGEGISLGDTILTANEPTKAQRVTPRVGVLWRPQEWLSIYANYAEGFGANFGQIYPGDPVPPTDARQWEVGAKAEFFDGRLRATFAYYNLTKTNVPTADLAHPGFSLITGAVNAKGPEFDLQGEILPGWNVILTYANTEARITKSENLDANGLSEVGDRFANVPRNTASLFTSYEFKQGDWKGLKFGGGANYQDAAMTLDFSGYRLKNQISPFATVDLFGAYSFNVGNAKLTAQLNVTNLLDTTYYTSGFDFAPPAPGALWNYRSYGEPRRFLGSISASF